MIGSKSSSLPSIMSSSEHQSMIPKEAIPRSKFDRSHGYKTTFNSGNLIPFYWDEVLPGDTHKVAATTLARLATPIVPIMDNFWAETFFFFVPYRLLWENWEKFCGAQDNPGDSTAFTTPKVNVTAATGYTELSLFDYFGLPTKITNAVNTWKPNAFNFRAYNLIWNEWFRDQNQYASRSVPVDNGPDGDALYTIQRRGARYNYFTSCLPWPQKGTALRVPMASATSDVLRYSNTTNTPIGRISGTNTASGGANVQYDSGGRLNNGSVQTSLDPMGSLYVNTIGGTINELREAEQLQVLLERDARGGTRYTESIRQHFGVISDDARLQRPEYLGGGRQNINITPVPQTSVTATTPQGNLAAFGTFGGSNGGFTKSFTEHGVVIGLISVTGDLSYQNGLTREYTRNTRYDYFWPALQNLGEQAVLKKEICTRDAAANDEVFGYNERYGEYKSKLSQVTGLMRSNAAASLDMWHLAQDYGVAPTLAHVVQDNIPLDRCIAVPTEPEFILDSHFRVTSSRPMQTYSIPGGRL
nr:MAG: major capsid protein [Microvirus sp.]